MELELISMHMEKKEKENGLTEKDSDGKMIQKEIPKVMI
jgi:hypothetical protein